MKDDSWILGGMVAVLGILSVRRMYDNLVTGLPSAVREHLGDTWAGTAFDWYAWWEGID